LIHELIPQVTGVDMVRFIIEQSLGVVQLPVPKPISEVAISRFVFAPQQGRMVDRQFGELQERMTAAWRKHPGDALNLNGSNTDRLGYLTAVAATLEAAEEAIAQIASQSTVTVVNDAGDVHQAVPRVIQRSGRLA
jgi:hypothetical protein